MLITEAAGALAAAVVTLRSGEGDHNGLLVAHVVLENDKNDLNKAHGITEIVLSRMRTRLALSHPQYIVPTVIVPVDEVPRTAHGKVDRSAVRALPLPETWKVIAEHHFIVPDAGPLGRFGSGTMSQFPHPS